MPAPIPPSSPPPASVYPPPPAAQPAIPYAVPGRRGPALPPVESGYQAPRSLSARRRPSCAAAFDSCASGSACRASPAHRAYPSAQAALPVRKGIAAVFGILGFGSLITAAVMHGLDRRLTPDLSINSMGTACQMPENSGRAVSFQPSVCMRRRMPLGPSSWAA